MDKSCKVAHVARPGHVATWLRGYVLTLIKVSPFVMNRNFGPDRNFGPELKVSPFVMKLDVFGPDRNFGQPGLDLLKAASKVRPESEQG